MALFADNDGTRSSGESSPGGFPSVLESLAADRAPIVLTGFNAIAIGSAVGAVLALAILRVDYGFSQASGGGGSFYTLAINGIISWAVFSFTIWSLLTCYRNLALIRAREHACKPAIVDALITSLQSDGLERTLQVLRDPRYKAQSFLRRASAVLEQWSMSSDANALRSALDHHHASDLEDLYARYAMVRVAVWALPVFGLVGTVLGIALSIGGFSQLLAGSVNDVVEIRTHLISVTGGLSFAFLLTLEGLATSLVVMLTVSVVQGRDERALRFASQTLEARLLPALQAVLPAIEANGSHVSANLDSFIEGVSRRLSLVLMELGDQMVAHLNDSVRSNLKDLEAVYLKSSESIVSLTDSACSVIEERSAISVEALAKVGEDVIGRMKDMGAGIEEIRESSERSLDAFSAKLKDAAEDLGDAHADYLRELKEVLGTVVSAVGSVQLGDLPDALGKLSLSLDELKPTLDEFRRPMRLSLIPSDI